MVCNNCGFNIPDGDNFCPSCGNRVSEPTVVVAPCDKKNDYVEAELNRDISPTPYTSKVSVSADSMPVIPQKSGKAGLIIVIVILSLIILSAAALVVLDGFEVIDFIDFFSFTSDEDDNKKDEDDEGDEDESSEKDNVSKNNGKTEYTTGEEKTTAAATEEETTASDSEDYYLSKAEDYLSQGKYVEAYSALDVAEELFGESAQTEALRKEIKKAQGLSKLDDYAYDRDYEGAIEYIDTVLSDFSDDGEIMNMRDNFVSAYRQDILNAAEGYVRAEEYETAISILEDALTVIPGDSGILDAIELYEEKLSFTKTPSTTAEIVEFYKNGVKRITLNGEAGYTKKEWQNVDEVNIGSSSVNNAVTGVLGNFLTVEADAPEQLLSKGSSDAKSRFPDWTLTDLNMISAAECVILDNGNYRITIIMKDEDTPKKSGSMLGQVTNSVLYWEDIDATLSTDSTVTAILNSYSDIHLLYRNFTITAEMTPDGKFVTLSHTGDVDILIGNATILGVFKIENKSGHMWNYCKYYNFKY